MAILANLKPIIVALYQQQIMKKYIQILPFFVTLLTLALGCRPKKLIVAPPPVATQTVVLPNEKSANFNLLESKNLSYTALLLKGKAILAVNGEENNVSMLIRIQKGKKIWISVSAIAGIEIARAVLTPDTLQLLNRLEKTYTKKPFSYIYDFTNKQINFNLLQAVLSGNTIDDFMVEKSDLVQENGEWILTGEVNNLVYRMVFNTLFKPTATTLNDAIAGQAFKVTYGAYTPINNALFPSTLTINTMSGAKKVDLAIEFNKIEADALTEFPFTVPKSFKLIN